CRYTVEFETERAGSRSHMHKGQENRVVESILPNLKMTIPDSDAGVVLDICSQGVYRHGADRTNRGCPVGRLLQLDRHGMNSRGALMSISRRAAALFQS